MTVEDYKDFYTREGVQRDWVDLRDQDYIPTLSVLKRSMHMDADLLRPKGKSGQEEPVFGVRNQGMSGRCAGFALANLIDIQRTLQRRREPTGSEHSGDDCARCDHDIVSADMLYRMAFFHDLYPDLNELRTGQEEGVCTLRSVVKGFYHHGTCLDWPLDSPTDDRGRWQSTCYYRHEHQPEQIFPSADQATSAREIGLGAYFRLASILNHYHAALNDAEGVLVSANIHDGWAAETPGARGVIQWPPKQGISGSHAFVLVGYDEHGFHVLNSWGADWGGYRGVAGLGLWPYADWAQNIIDGWVLRLGVSAPDSFGLSIGEKGIKGVTSKTQSGSTPCAELAGHYMHLDDGFPVTKGAYPSLLDRDGLNELLRKNTDPELTPDTAKGLIVWIPGSMEGIQPAFTTAVERKSFAQSLGMYPYTIFWCNNFVQKSLEVLNTIFESCEQQAGSDARHLDSLIEQQVQGVGRALWRDIEMSALRSVRGPEELPFERDEHDSSCRIKPGLVARFFADIVSLKVERGIQLHLIAEGAGALVLHEMLALASPCARDKDGVDPVFSQIDPPDIFDSLHLVHPAIGMPRASKYLLPLVRAMNGDIIGEPTVASTAKEPNIRALLKDTNQQPRARIYVPTEALEKDLHFGLYGKSILHLVARSFEDRRPAPAENQLHQPVCERQPRQFLGMASIAKVHDFPARGAIYRLNRTHTQRERRDRVSQTELLTDPTIQNHIFETIGNIQKKH